MVADIIDYVKLILEFPNIDVNSQSLKVDTPLHFAACFNRIESVKMLMNHPKINPNPVGCVYNFLSQKVSFKIKCIQFL